MERSQRRLKRYSIEKKETRNRWKGFVEPLMEKGAQPVSKWNELPNCTIRVAQSHRALVSFTKLCDGPVNTPLTESAPSRTLQIWVRDLA
jgi:hypothetical protein